MASLRISEIFYSLQGESVTQGKPTVFIRLTGCPLRCHYCDTTYAFSGGQQRSTESLLEEVQSFNCRYVTVTGGEPLAQPDCTGLLNDLCDLGFQVSLETAGALDVSQVDKRVSIVMDLKTPGSGEVTRNLYSNLDRLSHKDQVKMVICDRIDYEWARFKLAEYDIGGRAGEVLLSPAWGQMDPAELAGWILGDKLSVRLQLQLHKQLWGDKPGV